MLCAPHSESNSYFLLKASAKIFPRRTGQICGVEKYVSLNEKRLITLLIILLRQLFGWEHR